MAVAMAIAFNAITLLGVLWWGWPPGNVYALFWLENLVLGIFGLVKVATARGAGKPVRLEINDRPAGNASPALLAVFFAFHYGIFCLVHGVFTGIVAVSAGLDPSFLFLGFPLILLVVRYTVETLTSWFGRGGLRDVVSPAQAMFQPYPRVIVLHLAVMLAFAVTINQWSNVTHDDGLGSVLARLDQLLPAGFSDRGVQMVLVLLVLKTVVDVFTTLGATRRRS